MQAQNTTFQQVIFGAKQFLIPVFQRDYKWQEDNWQKLWDDILGAGTVGHFAGSIVHASNAPFSSIPTYLVIDGQQRLATLTVLCVALRDHIRETGWKGNGAGPTADQIDEYCVKNNLETGDRKYKLALRRSDNDALRAVVDGHPPDHNESGTKLSLIEEAYLHFRDLLREGNVDPGEIYRGIMGLRLVEMTLDRNIDNPQTIFESMNSTGVDLSHGDLVRNYLLMGVEEAEQTRLYEQYWQKIEGLFRGHDSALDSFIRDYIALKRGDTKPTRVDQIYEEFKRFRQSEFASPGVEEQLQEMLRFSDYCAKFRGLAVETSGELSQALANVRYHGDTSSVLVMRLFDCRHNGYLGLADFVTALDTIESYLIRRAAAGSHTGSHWANFANLARQVEDSSPLDSLLLGFTQLRGAQAFPTDVNFREVMEERELFHTQVCRQVLSRLENHGSKEPSPTSTYSIEHIMPQNQNLPLEWQRMLGDNWQEDHERWLHRLGNLTLTAYNSQYSDRSFEDKKTISGGFNESAIRLNAYVREQQTWTAETIAERGRLLAGRALEVWQYPKPATEYVEALRSRRIRERADGTDVTRVPMTGQARNLFAPLHNEIIGNLHDIQAVRERNSVCYYTSSSNFFLELLPRKYSLTLLFDADMSEITDINGLAEDGNDRKFIPNSSGNHPYRVLVEMWSLDQVDCVMQIIRQAHNLVPNYA